MAVTVRWALVEDLLGVSDSLSTAAERGRAARFRDPADAQRHLAGRAALRLLVAQTAGCEAREVTIEVDPAGRGKPQVTRPSARSSSISHDGPFVVVAIADGPVGVDVQLILSHGAVADVLQVVASDDERHAVLAAENSQRAATVLWASKEAVAKAHGDGLSVTELDVGPQAVCVVAADPDEAPPSWGQLVLRP